jgi:hypothetical protein
MDQVFDLFVAYAIWQFDKGRRAEFTAPLPRNVVGVSQQFQVGAQGRPIALNARIERMKNHERVNSRSALQH